MICSSSVVEVRLEEEGPFTDKIVYTSREGDGLLAYFSVGILLTFRKENIWLFVKEIQGLPGNLHLAEKMNPENMSLIQLDHNVRNLFPFAEQ